MEAIQVAAHYNLDNLIGILMSTVWVSGGDDVRT